MNKAYTMSWLYIALALMSLVIAPPEAPWLPWLPVAMAALNALYAEKRNDH